MSLRELFQAVEAKHRRQWADWSYALHWILNAMPNFGATPRQPIEPDDINPFTIGETESTGDAIPLTTDNPDARAGLDAWARRAEDTRRVNVR